MENKKVILLLSGGIDSTTLLAKLSIEGYEVIAISFYYGQKHQVELEFAKKNAEKYGVKKHHLIKLDSELFNTSALVNKNIAIDTYEIDKLPQGQVNVYVPFRNLIFISIALSFAEATQVNEVYLAFNRDDKENFWDCREQFIEKINGITSLNTFIKIKTPFIDLSKREVIKLAHQLKVDLNNTITCYQPNEVKECGVCLSCLTKIKALKDDNPY